MFKLRLFFATLISLLFIAHVFGRAESPDSSRSHASSSHTSGRQEQASTPSPRRSAGSQKNKPSAAREEPKKDLTRVADDNSFGTDCSDRSLCANARAVALDIEAQRLLYNSAKLTDCSGIFHRFLDALAERCPAMQRPPSTRYRSTRDLAYWFDQQGRLTLIRDALDEKDRIRPGVVMFYGTRRKIYRRFDLDDLLGYPGGIQHMGVVTDVSEVNGELTYELFHGRSSGKLAGITKFHRQTPSRAHLPPLGNWDQQWVAVATLVPDGVSCR